MIGIVSEQEEEEWARVYSIVAVVLSLFALASSVVVLYLVYQVHRHATSSVEMAEMGGSRSDEEIPVRKTCANRRKMDPHLVRQAFPAPTPLPDIFPPLIFVPSWPKVVGIMMFALFVTGCVTVGRDALTEVGLPPSEVLKYFSLPVVCVAFTYGHIWLALWMTFYPLDFSGVPGTQIEGLPAGLGWQGIVPSKCRKIATRSVRNFSQKVLPIEDLFQRVDPQGLQAVLRGPIFKEIKDILNELGTTEAPEVWRLMPDVVKEELAVKLTEDLPNTVNSLFNRVQKDIMSFFDMEEFCVEGALRNKALFVHKFVEKATPELEFIRDCGGYMGVIFGFVQMFQQYFYPANWLLPAYAGGLGLLTNWMALKITFWPLEPTPLFGGRIVLHGAFMKRQHEFAAAHAADFTNTFGTAKVLIPGIAIGRCSEMLCGTIQDELDKGIDRSSESVMPIIRATGCEENYARFKQFAIEKVSDSMPEILMHAQAYIDEKMDLERNLKERMRALAPADFEEMLHPTFQDEEWLLIIVGGVLGVLVGFFQMWVIGA